MRVTFNYIVIIAIFMFALSNYAQTKNPYDSQLVVVLDGSGKFSSIQSAIDSIPDTLSSPMKIFIKNGIYKEKIFIRKNFITLIGESRENTSIIYPELRRKWRETNDDQDWGSAVINIADSVTNLTLVNLFIYNNYGSLYDDHDHQFAVRGGGTKIGIINCYIKSDGGDALSLWNSDNGMYFHTKSKFEGWVDFVCPRGWCYITDSEFFSHSKTAAIWHDGSNNKDQKFVIRNSSFDGIPNFPLGRNHRDGQFFLIDCKFSKNMIDTPIYIVRYPDSTKNKPVYWGERYYYYNCHREEEDYNWYKNNLEEYDPILESSEINGSWIFNNRWNPEKEFAEFLSNNWINENF